VANNLHISYDLNAPHQNYEAVIAKIKELGSWAKIEYSFWYVNSTFTASQARDFLLPVIDSNDTLYVVDATNNQAAWSNSVTQNVSDFIKDNWLK
jgi:hypothetical protein